MPIRIPRGRRVMSLLSALAIGLFGLLLLAFGVSRVLGAADRRLDCDGRSRTCTLDQRFHLHEEHEAFDARRMGPPTTGRDGTSSSSVVVVPERDAPGRTVAFGALSSAEAGSFRDQLDALRSGAAATDIHLAGPNRWGTTAGAAVVAGIGVGALLAAAHEARGRRRRRAGERSGVPSLPTAGADRANDQTSEHERDLEAVHQQQLAPIVACLGPWVGEPIVAAGSFVPAGAVRRELGWPAWVMVVVTPTTLLALGVAFETNGVLRPQIGYRVLGVLGRWPLDAVECAEDGGNLTTRSLFVQAPGWPLVELVDGAGRGGRLAANDRVYRLLVPARTAATI